MIYVLHDDDEDGFASCYAAQLKFGTSACYIAVKRGDSPPPMPDASEIFILDFNYPRDVMQALAERCSVVLLDHHISAQIELLGLPYCHFDTSKSAAVISWEYFWPDEPVPLFMLYVQDQDLWKFEMSCSKEIRAAVQAYPRDFAMWKAISGIDMPRSTGLESIALSMLEREGRPICRFISQQINRVQSRSAVFIIGPQARISFDPDEAQIGPDRFIVPVVNASALQSEIANNLLVAHPEAKFVAYYYDAADGVRHWGLRSRPDETDVSLIAKLFGGGGHRCASGFMTSHDASYGLPVKPAVTAAMSADTEPLLKSVTVV